MKFGTNLFAALLLIGFTTPALTETLATNTPTEFNQAVNFRNVPLKQVLRIYSDVAHVHLIIASDVTLEGKTLNLVATAHTRQELQKLIEGALEKQADISIVQEEGQNARVTRYKKQDDQK